MSSLDTFTNHPYTATGSGTHHKLACPDCTNTLHTHPNTSRSRRTCRGCKVKWLILGNLSKGEPCTLRRLTDPTTKIVERVTMGETDEGAVRSIVLEALKEIVPALNSKIDAHNEAGRAYTDEAVSHVAPIIRTLAAPIKKTVTVEGDRHYCYDELMETVTALQLAFLVGPAGSGKTTLCEQVAKDLEMDFGFLSCTEGLSEAHILGRMDINGNYISSDFVRIFENGGVFLFDEIDAMDANVAIVLNEALANGNLSVPNRTDKPLAKKHSETIILAAANTFGTGASTVYVGRNQLDGATLDRFAAAQIDVNYDHDREAVLAAGYGISSLVKKIWTIRANALQAKVRRPVSTRWVINAGKLHSLNPTKWTDEALLAKLMCAWTEQERAKVLTGALQGVA